MIMPQGIDSEEQLSQLTPEYIYSNFNRQPRSEEIIACQLHIEEIITSFKPQGIVYLGQVARNSHMTNRKSLSLVHPSFISKQEYKVIPMRKEAKKLYDFIKDIKGKYT